jgi:hypothetical protein
MAMKKSKAKQIDFTKIDWEKVSMEKAKFFFQEALDYNNKVIEDLNNLNNKAFALLAGALPAFSAAIGFLIALWGKTDREAVTYSLVFACSGLGIVVILLFLAVFPRDFYRGEGAPEVFFSDAYYKADMYTIYTGSIASLHKYITYNYRVMKYRSRLILLSLVVFISILIITALAFFYLYSRN